VSHSKKGKGSANHILAQEHLSFNVDELLAQALDASSSAGDRLKSAQETRSKAEEQLARAEMEAVEMAEMRRQEIVREAERQLRDTRLLHGEAEKAKREAERELDEARRTRSEAEEYRKQLERDAEEQAQKLMTEVREAGQAEVDQMKRDAAEEIRQRMREADTLKAAIQEEFEAQRLLTRAAEVRARYSPVLPRPEQAVDQTTPEPAPQEVEVIESIGLLADLEAVAPKPKAKKAESEE